MDSEFPTSRSANYPSFSPSAEPLGDVGSASASATMSKTKLATNLTAVQDQILESLSSLDSVMASADGQDLGRKLLSSLVRTGDALERAAAHVVASDDGCEALVDGLLNIKPDQPLDAEHEYLKATLLSVINTSPPVLNDLAAAIKGMTLDEAVEIAEVGLELGSVGILVASFALEKVDVEGIVDEVYEGNGMGLNGDKRSESLDAIEFLDEDGNNSDPDASRTSSPLRRRGARPLKRQPLVFWPRLASALASPFTDPSHPLRAYISSNPRTSLLLSLFLLTPPPVILAAILIPPALVTDEVVRRVYGSLVDSYPEAFQGVEVTANQVREVVRLYFLTAKLVLKATLRVGQRQVKRRGGVTGVAKDVAARVWDAATHPVDTAQSLWSFGKDTVSLARDLAGFAFGTDAEVSSRQRN